MRKLFLMAVLGLPLCACATVTKGTDDTVRLETEPPGATASIVDVGGTLQPVTCTTPCKIELNRKKSYDVTFTMDGYETAQGSLVPKFSADGGVGLAGNLILGGVIGAGVDAATGAANDLKPNPLNVALAPITASNAVAEVTDQQEVQTETAETAETAEAAEDADDIS